MVALSTCATRIVALAVMPGRSAPSLLFTITTLVYVTTFETVVGFWRTCCTVAWKVRLGYASTLKSTPSPARTRPMSGSPTARSSSILPRSWAMVNRVGVCKLAATVCPIDTLRAITVPSTGEVMMVCARLALATATLACWMPIAATLASCSAAWLAAVAPATPVWSPAACCVALAEAACATEASAWACACCTAACAPATAVCAATRLDWSASSWFCAM